MTAEERIFSIVRGGLYAKLPSLALPLGRLQSKTPSTLLSNWEAQTMYSGAVAKATCHC